MRAFGSMAWTYATCCRWPHLALSAAPWFPHAAVSERRYRERTMGRQHRLLCDNVSYRRGEFEITPNIHRGLVNLEAWTIHPDAPLPDGEGTHGELPDEAYTGNVEIELTPEQARRLAAAILEAAGAAESTAVFELEGMRITTLDDFYEEISRVLIPDCAWGRNLDALNDILRGGFGTPDGGFTIRWRDHELSRSNLGHAETVRQLQRRLERCHPTNRDAVARDLEAARRGDGPTVFDWLIEIIRDHGPGGAEGEDGVVLELH